MSVVSPIPDIVYDREDPNVWKMSRYFVFLVSSPFPLGNDLNFTIRVDTDPDDIDVDKDGVKNSQDSCLKLQNQNQSDIDRDGIGDACDDDMDDDGILNAKDNCPKISNKNQNDTDKNGVGDVCDEKYQAALKPDLIITDAKANQLGGAVFVKNIGKGNIKNKDYSVGIVRASRMRSVGQKDNVNYTGRFDFVLPMNKDILSNSTANLSFSTGILDPNDKEGYYLYIDLGNKLPEEREDNNFYFTCFHFKSGEKCDPYRGVNVGP